MTRLTNDEQIKLFGTISPESEYLQKRNNLAWQLYCAMINGALSAKLGVNEKDAKKLMRASFEQTDDFLRMSVEEPQT